MSWPKVDVILNAIKNSSSQTITDLKPTIETIKTNFDEWKVPWTAERAGKIDNLDVAVSTRSPSFIRKVHTTEEIVENDFLTLTAYATGEMTMFAPIGINNRIRTLEIDSKRTLVAYQGSDWNFYLRVVSMDNGIASMGDILELTSDGLAGAISMTKISETEVLVFHAASSTNTDGKCGILNISNLALNYLGDQTIYTGVTDYILESSLEKTKSGKYVLLNSFMNSMSYTGSSYKTYVKIYEITISSGKVTLASQKNVIEATGASRMEVWSQMQITSADKIFITSYGKVNALSKAIIVDVSLSGIGDTIFELNISETGIPNFPALCKIKEDFFAMYISKYGGVSIFFLQATADKILLVSSPKEGGYTSLDYRAGRLFYDENLGSIFLVVVKTVENDYAIRKIEIDLTSPSLNLANSDIIQSNFRGYELSLSKMDGSSFLFANDNGKYLGFFFELTSKSIQCKLGGLFNHDAIAKTRPDSEGYLDAYVPVAFKKGV